MSSQPDMSGGLPQQGSPWRKSRHSMNNGNCVEVAVDLNQVVIRDSANRLASTVRCSTQAWRAFLDRASRGEYDVGAA